MIDTRSTQIKSRNGLTVKAINISNIDKIKDIVLKFKPQVVIFDEIQFFD